MGRTMTQRRLPFELDQRAEFRDRNVPAASGNRRVVEQALAALPVAIEAVHVAVTARSTSNRCCAGWRRAGSATPSAPRWGASWRWQSGPCPRAHGGARADAHAVRHWAEVPYVPSDGVATKDRPEPPRYLTIRITEEQDEPFADGGVAKHFAIVTNLPDPPGGRGVDLIRWQRAKAGMVEHSHHVQTNSWRQRLCRPSASAPMPPGPPQRAALQPAVGVQAGRPARGAARRPAQAAALRAAQRRRQGGAPCARDRAQASREARRQLADHARLALGRGPPLATAA